MIFYTYGHSYGGSAWKNGAITSLGDIVEGRQKAADRKIVSKRIILVENLILIEINSE